MKRELGWAVDFRVAKTNRGNRELNEGGWQESFPLVVLIFPLWKVREIRSPFAVAIMRSTFDETLGTECVSQWLNLLRITSFCLASKFSSL